MENIKPSEISSILKSQLEDAEISQKMEEIGVVLEVGDGIARVFGLSKAQYGELVSFETGVEGMVLNLEIDHVGVVLLEPSTEIREGDKVTRTKRIASIQVAQVVLIA